MGVDLCVDLALPALLLSVRNDAPQKGEWLMFIINLGDIRFLIIAIVVIACFFKGYNDM